MEQLTGSQKKYLRGLAHSADPVVMIGAKGLTEGVLRTIDAELEHRELIKVRFNEFKDQKKALCAEIEQKTGATVVGMVGHVATCYRRQADDKKRKIELPARPGG